MKNQLLDMDQAGYGVKRRKPARVNGSIEQQTLKYTRRISCVNIIGLVLVGAIVGMFIGLLAGGIKTITSMDVMTKMMGDMNGRMDEPAVAIRTLLEKFPGDQMETTARQGFDMLANAHKITARLDYLLNRLEPEQLTTMVQHVHGITERVEHALAQLNDHEVALIKNHAMGILEQTHNVLSGVKKDDITSLITHITRVAANVDVAKVNELVEHTSAIEKRLRELHEIKIQI